MIFLPIVDRELRVASRQRSTFRMRYGSAAMVIILWISLRLVGEISSTQLGVAVFAAMATGIFAVALMAGTFLTAEAVAAERSEGTLGLLFLTELRGYDVVLGKLVATSIRAFYGLLAAMPVLAIPLLTGGVTIGEFWRMVLVILSGLFLSLTVGLMMSVLSRDARSAMAAAVLGLLMLGGLPWVLYWCGRFFLDLTHYQVEWLLYPSPFAAFIYAFDSHYWTLDGPRMFWIAAGIMQGFSLLALSIASIVITRNWRETGETTEKVPNHSIRKRFRFGNMARRRRYRAWLTPDPYYWLATRDRGPMLRFWMVFGPCLAIWTVLWLCFVLESGRGGETGFICAFFTGFGLHLVLKGFVAAEASRRFLEDRQNGAMELLLATPLPVRDMIAGQRRALWQIFLAPILVLVMVNVLLLIVALNQASSSGEEVPLFFLTFVAGTTNLFVDFSALCSVGMWMALNTNRHHQAITRTLRRIMLLPWLGFGLFFFMIFANAFFGGVGALLLMIGLWAIGGVVISVFAKARATNNLEQRFRELVATGGKIPVAERTQPSEIWEPGSPVVAK